jgi:RNA polymerase sigma-70 factor (ECF subfamily)
MSSSAAPALLTAFDAALRPVPRPYLAVCRTERLLQPASEPLQPNVESFEVAAEAREPAARKPSQTASALPARLESGVQSEVIAMIPALRRRAWRWCRDPAEAEDLVQETLLRVLGAGAEFDSQNHVRAWLYTVLRNLFISRRRRDQSAKRALSELGAVASSRAAAAPPAAPFLTRSVERALASLPEAFARVVRLVDLEEHSYSDAAEVLGIPVGTVMSRLFRGRQRLAQQLADAKA